MRRRMRSAALPVHRHSLLQLGVDAGLIALAYYLAYQLRFDRGVPDRYEQLLETTIAPVVLGTVTIFALSGIYQRWWRFLSQRDYERLLRGVVIATVLLVGVVAIVHPVRLPTRPVSTTVSGAPADSRRGRARRGGDSHPLRAGNASRAGNEGLPRPGDPRAHAADRLRAAAVRGQRHAPAARVARGGRAR